MIRFGKVVTGGILLAVFTACGDDSNGSPNPPPSAITINLVSSPAPAFSPVVDTIAVGGIVTWQWDAGTHDVTSFSLSGSPTFPDEASHTGVQAPQTIMPVAGTYHFYCTNHGSILCPAGSMCGTIVAR